MNESLIESYKQTSYQVTNSDLVIKIGEHSTGLDSILNKLKVKSFCFITAYNPFSK